MADSADLVVLGGFLGTGNKGGMCSVFLMGTYCPTSHTWKTVCKVGNGCVSFHYYLRHFVFSLLFLYRNADKDDSILTCIIYLESCLNMKIKCYNLQ